MRKRASVPFMTPVIVAALITIGLIVYGVIKLFI
jgi:hypothetical protein